MGRSRPAGGAERRLTALLFTDLVGSTELATRLGDERWRRLLERHHKAIRRELKRFRGRELDTAGDGFFASFDAPAAAIRCASAAMNAVADLGLQLRAGVHMGEAVEMDRKVGGFAVHVAARIAALAGPDEVLVSSTVRDMVGGSGIGFEAAGEHTLKGVDEPWRLYRVHRHADLAPRPVADITPPEPGEPARRRRWLVPAAIAGVLAVGATVFTVTRDGAPPVTPPTGSAAVYTDGLFRIDPATNDVFAQNDDVLIPVPIVRGGEFLWIGDDRGVAKFSPSADAYVARIRLSLLSLFYPEIAISEGTVWVVNHPSPGQGDSRLFRIDPSTNLADAGVPIRREVYGLVVTGEGHWMAAADGAVVRVDPASGDIEREILVGGHLLSLVEGERALWALDADGEVERVDPVSGAHASVTIESPLAIAVGEGSLWVTTAAGTLVRFDARTLERTGQVEVGERGFALAVGAGSVWVGTRGTLDRDGEVVRVDPETVEVGHAIGLGGRAIIMYLLAEDDAVWLGSWSGF